MLVVTGGAGFIGINIVRGLNDRGHEDILIVDELNHPDKLANLNNSTFRDALDKDEFRRALSRAEWISEIRTIFHQGACTDTLEHDRNYLMRNNVDYSKWLLHYALEKRIPFVYASSAAVYGANTNFSENAENERPLSDYGHSKLLFDQHVRQVIQRAESSVVGLRYFNVYGPNEAHKGRMASLVYQIYRQLKETGTVRLFEGTDGFADGEQLRDFIYVDDVVETNLFFAFSPLIKGIFNVGTGKSRRFNDIAKIWISILGFGEFHYFPAPDEVKVAYQSHTRADITALRRKGFGKPFIPLEEGIVRYAKVLMRDEYLAF
ncbi:ADP-glyceromanno-heptose 6-epimerase [candidate division KSB1 bacterium]|nr:ADP-glyceromanno-heptose 6-epimerase [candidate division KSB1 bacterium]NIR70318.1 ADP-glyceromanno-heptose 6-epimerase [candidate division KSB1 bacterium]NIS27622.1 ADP-glyceromanno-heptose 6-epimerase [candidate division KSB1 bacterium]NIT74462.1 ADP-glyceromanno-heptose 6-epimerase [candidate division KSB1 bacterium]NIU28987.1 ADP-glyceromanno-heptose 6-epimerase [candidate division KSB1 bacterium]